MADIPPVVEGDRLCPDSADIDRVAEVLRTAKCPAILAGSAVIHANATDALCSLAEDLNIPVVYTRLGEGGYARWSSSDCGALFGAGG